MGQGKLSQAFLDKVIVVAILATIFFLPLSSAITTVCLLLASVLWLGKLVKTRGKCFRHVAFDRWVLGFVIVSLASVAVSPDKFFSFYNYCNLMGRYLLLYYLIVQNITTLRQVKLIGGLMLLSGIVVTLYGFYQYFFGIDVTNMLWIDGEQFPELKTRVFSTLQNPNILAGYLIVMMSLILGVICKIKLKGLKICLGIVFMLMGMCLAMTYCRGAWLSLLMVIGAYGAFKNRKIILLLGCFILVAGLFDTSLSERLISAFSASDTSSNMRLGIWESTLAMIVDHPLMGIGWGVYWQVYPQYDFFIQNDAVKIVHAHNMYLNFAAEIGIIGMVLFVAIMFKHLVLALSNTHLRESNLLNGIVLGAGLAILAMAINGFTDYVLFNIELSMLFWLVCALIVVVCRRKLP